MLLLFKLPYDCKHLKRLDRTRFPLEEIKYFALMSRQSAALNSVQHAMPRTAQLNYIYRINGTLTHKYLMNLRP